MKTDTTHTSFQFIEPAFAEKTDQHSAPQTLVRSQYLRAIEALELDPKERERFLRMEQLDRFRGQLEARLRKTKLWNYAPEQRDSVKEARAYLQAVLGIENIL